MSENGTEHSLWNVNIFTNPPPGTTLQALTLQRYLFWIAMPFTLVSCYLSFMETYRHFRNYNAPTLQRQIVRIILMVPVYSLVEWIHIGFFSIGRYLDLGKSCYEAFVLLCFFYLLIEYLGGEQLLLLRLKEKSRIREIEEANIIDEPGFSCRPSDWRWFRRLKLLTAVGSYRGFIWNKRGLMQLVLIMPIASIIAVLMDVYYVNALGVQPPRSYYWLIAVNFVSMSIALLAVGQLYNILAEDLEPFRPIPKFFCIKAVIFLAFYQRFTLQVIFAFWPEMEHALLASEEQIGGFLVTIELLGAAVAHLVYFSHREFLYSPVEEDEFLGTIHQNPARSEPTKTWMSFWKAARDALVCIDVVKDSAIMFVTREVDEDFNYRGPAKIVDRAPPETPAMIPLNSMSTSPSMDSVGATKSIQSPQRRLSDAFSAAPSVDEAAAAEDAHLEDAIDNLPEPMIPK